MGRSSKLNLWRRMASTKSVCLWLFSQVATPKRMARRKSRVKRVPKDGEVRHGITSAMVLGIAEPVSVPCDDRSRTRSRLTGYTGGGWVQQPSPFSFQTREDHTMSAFRG